MKKMYFLVAAFLFAALGNLKAQTVLFQDSFETYTNFAISGVGNWTLTDVDGSNTYGIGNTYVYDNKYVPKAYMVFNSTATNPVMASPTSESDWSARTGNKAMVCFAAVMPADGGNGPNNDWLISPQIQLVASGNTLSFWGKTCDNSYNERFRVYVSTTNTNTASFTALQAVQTTGTNVNWKEYTYSLDAYAGQNVYIAIQCTSSDQYGFAIDDFKVTGPSVACDGAAVTGVAVTTSGLNANVTWNNKTGVDHYVVQYRKVGDPTWTNVTPNPTTNSVTISSLALGNYEVQVANVCTGETAPGAFSAPKQFTIQLVYCIPTGVAGNSDEIRKFVLGSISNSSAASEGNGYADYTATVPPADLVIGNSYVSSITIGAGTQNHGAAIWIDYNENGIFEASEKVAVLNNINPTNGTTFNFPAFVADNFPGVHRLRVQYVWSQTGESLDPCVVASGALNFGEVEDYLVNIIAPAPTGCLTATNGQWPSATFTPTCNGAAENITTAGFLNEYSKVNVTAGTAYTFSTSNASYFITIGDEAGTTVLASGTGSVTYTPTASGVIRFYSHLTNACDGGSTIHTRSVKCGTPPVDCTDFFALTPAGGIENAGFFGGSTNQRIATDIPVGSSGFTVYGMEPTVAHFQGGGAATMFSFKIYEDNGAGLPGTQVGTRTGIIMGSTQTGSAFGRNFYKYTVAFDTPINFNANTTYWIEVVSDAEAWESKTNGFLGNVDAFNNDSSGGAWTHGTTPSQYIFSLICSQLAVSEAGNKNQVSFYPNPVKDYLTISSKTKIETVHVYNVAGQKMPISSTVVNGRIDMSKLASGVYIISTILEGGRNESFKVLKQ